MKCHAGTVRSVDFSWDSQHLLTASDDKTIKMWALPSRRFVRSFNGHANWVRSAVFSPDGSAIASASDDKTVRLWDAETGAEGGGAAVAGGGEGPLNPPDSHPLPGQARAATSSTTTRTT